MRWTTGTTWISGKTGRQQFIIDLDPAGYDRLRNSIHDLCWGEDELPARIDRLADQVGGFNRDTGTRGFTGLQASRTLAICHPDRFLPVPNHEGEWGRVHMLRKLGLPAPSGTTYGQRVVDANDRLRKHLASHLDDDPQAIAGFLYWLRRHAGPDGDGDKASDLSSLVARFRDESGYPTAAHEEQRQLQAEWAEKLAPENIANLSRLDLTAVASHGTWYAGTYVYPHARGVMKWIRALDGGEYAGMLDHIRYLCWSDDEPWRRYDQLTDAAAAGRPLVWRHSTTGRLLAIAHPQDFLAIGVQGGEWGRAAMLRRLGLPKPAGSSYGQKVMDADRRLREHLEPHFDDDTLEMGAFLRWLLVQEPLVPPVALITQHSIDPGELEELADELLVDVEFLEDIVELLKDKGQVILYGPPGTGKTYLARKLAKVLAPDESRRALVQFHPSTSYEDFFEGYRPAETGKDGGIRYELTPGPLARMSERASGAPEQHVMIIDEINRGNLPRVLGELLFLLEYRKESARTLYRPEEPFELPENLWFIGTMNTADRSIALVDAALRRRFHFVPFFPDSGPMAGLLTRWLEREDQPDWIGRLVDAVNDELTRELGGSHLLLGPSHFMREYGPSPNEQRDRLRRIWEYNIEPFIEDQFFGDPGQISRFRFGSIVSRHRAIIERDRLSFLADGEETDQGAEASGSSEAQNSLERSRARGATTPAWKDQFQGTPTAPTGDDELWKWRASNFPRRTEGRGEFQINEIRSLACRWVEFALNAGVDPGRHDANSSRTSCHHTAIAKAHSRRISVICGSGSRRIMTVQADLAAIGHHNDDIPSATDPRSSPERYKLARSTEEDTLLSVGDHAGPLTLREYGSKVVRLSEEQAGALNLSGGGKYLGLEPEVAAGQWRVTANHYVGSINVAGLQVLVRPKIPLRNLFLLLEVGLRPQDWHDEAVRFETTGDLLPSLVSFFARTTETTLARGLYHSYREQRDRLVALRGRVDIARQLAQPGVVIPTACRFTEFTADLIENSYLKAAVSRSLRVAGVQPVDRRRLMQHLVTLEDVSDVPHRPADDERVMFSRLNEHYRPALRLARLVLANLTLQDAIGETQASSFMLDMNKLFEQFVTERLRRALRGRLDVKGQHQDRLDEERTVAIKPDLVFRSGGSPRFVADIKYKLTDEAAGGRNADYYQLLAYTTALDLPEGVLIYCLDANRPDDADGNGSPVRSSGSLEPTAPAGTAAVSSIRVRHAGKVLHTYALDLSGTADDVARNVLELSDWIVERAAAST